MNKKSAIVIFIGCLLILTNFSIVTSAVTVSTNINKNPQKTIEKIDPTSIKNENVTSPETYKVVPTTQEKSAPPLEENKVTITKQNEKNAVINKVPDGGGIVVQPGQHAIPGQQQAFLYVANAGGSYSGFVGQAIQFSGSSSYLPINGVTYSWDFNEDGIYEWSSTDSGVTTYTYAKPGNYLATFKVTKSDGKTYIDMASVDVSIDSNHLQPNNHLHPHGGCCYYGSVGKPILFDASQSTSTNSSLPITSYIWHFGDGTVGYGKKVYHTYNESIPYLVHLEIQDSAGNKRFDVLHADIGCKLSKYDDFLATSNQIVQNILSYITDSRLFFYLLDVKVITIFNGITNETTITDGFDEHYPKVIDAGNGAQIQINHISLFKYENLTISAFTGMASHTWNSTFSAQILSGISESDNFTILLEFSFGSWIASKLGIEEPKIQIGYTSKAGEEKPTTEFTISHRFRPYILERLGLYGNSQNNENEEYNQNEAATYTSNTQVYPSEQTQAYNDYEINPAPIENTGVQEIKSEQSLQAQAIQQTINGNPLGGTDFYPEQEVKFENIDVDHFSLVIAFENNANRTELNLSFDHFVDSTIKSKRFQDVGFNGYEQNNDTSLTLTISRYINNGKRATLGLIINPIHNFITQVNYAKDPNTEVRTLSFNIDNPPKNLVLFAESVSSWGDYKSNYLYLENIPHSLTFEILPKLDGYIIFNRKGNDTEFKIGIKNDLENPTVNIYLTHPATYDETKRVDWNLLSDPYKISFSSNTPGLKLTGEIKDINHQDQNIKLQATILDPFEVGVEWSFSQKYLKLQKSETTIDFNASYHKDSRNLIVNASRITGPGNIKFDFNNFDEQGSNIWINSSIERDISLHIYAEDLDFPAYFSADAAITKDLGGQMQIKWDRSKTVHLQTNIPLNISNLSLNVPGKFNLFTEEISFSRNGLSSFDIIKGDDALPKLELTAFSQNRGITIKNVSVSIGNWTGTLECIKLERYFKITLKPQTKEYEIDGYSLGPHSDKQLEVHNVTISYNHPTYGFKFGLGSFELEHNGSIKYDHSQAFPKFHIETSDLGSSSYLHIDNLYFRIGTAINFTLSSFHMDKPGTIYADINGSNSYKIETSNVAFDWSLDLQTTQYGHWQFNGNYNGSGKININEWNPGTSGQIYFYDIGGPLSHSFNISHNYIKIELAEMNLYTGSSYPKSIALEWSHQQLSKGWLNLTNAGVYGSISLVKITINPQNPIIIELGNCTIQQTTVTNPKTSISFDRTTNQKNLSISSNRLMNLALAKLTWDNGNKSLDLGNLALNPGNFKLILDTTNKIITVNNGMLSLNPTYTYEDADRKLSASLLFYSNDYSKTTTLKFIEENNKIIGLYLDTSNTQLLDGITFTSIRKNQDPTQITGRSITLSGFKANNFQIKRNTSSGKLDVSGKLDLVNQIIYSKLSDYQTNQWKSLTINLDVDYPIDGVGSIEFNTDPGFNEDITLSTTLAGGTNISATFNLTQHVYFGWAVNFSHIQGNITIDNDYAETPTMIFEISKDKQGYHPKWGFRIAAEYLRAEDYKLFWNFTGYDPSNWDLHHTGDIDFVSLSDLSIAWHSVWYDLLLNGGQPQPS